MACRCFKGFRPKNGCEKDYSWDMFHRYSGAKLLRQINPGEMDKKTKKKEGFETGF